MSQSYVQFYSNIAFHNGLEKLMSDFLGNKQLLDNGFEYLKEYDYYLKDELVIDAVDPEFDMTIINRERYLRDILLKQRKNLYNILKTTPDGLKATLDELNVIFTKIEQQKDQTYFAIIIEELLNVVGDLKLQYSNISEYHPIYNKLRQVNSSLSYFLCKDLSNSFFSELYEITYTLNLIDDVVVTEDMFIEVFTFPKPNAQIVFIQSNPIIAYYLKEIEPFFDNLSAVTIEKSKCFFNKQGKPIKSTDLYTSLSRGKEKNVAFKNKINYTIEALRKKYLN